MSPQSHGTYKIQQMNGMGRVGITATDLKDLKKQAVKRFEDITEDFEPHLDDGTAVLTEKYFESLPEQTCFTFYAPREGNLKMGKIECSRTNMRFDVAVVINQLARLQSMAVFVKILGAPKTRIRVRVRKNGQVRQEKFSRCAKIYLSVPKYLKTALYFKAWL